MHPIAAKAADAIEKALRQFGEYSYYDKGPHEVMDIDAFVSELRPLPGDDIGRVLIDVLRDPHGRAFVSSVLSSLDDLEDEKWNAIMAYTDLEELY